MTAEVKSHFFIKNSLRFSSSRAHIVIHKAIVDKDKLLSLNQLVLIDVSLSDDVSEIFSQWNSRAFLHSVGESCHRL